MSIFDHAESVPPAPSWRCPHCGTLQPETERCRACLRSPVCCGSCQAFRRSVVSELTYCGLKETRTPVHRDEVHACWRPNTNEIDPEAGLFTQAQPVPVAAGIDAHETLDRVAPQVADDGLVEAPHVPPRGAPKRAGHGPALAVGRSGLRERDLD